MRKIDVCINYYGKPFQTIVTLKTLWQQSSRHINHIYVILEKEQPHNQYFGISLLKHFLYGLPIIYFTPKFFYYGVGSPPLSWLEDPEKRYGLNFQYALEKTECEFLFITHNDCLYKEDFIGKMFGYLDQSVDEKSVAGIGLIGQCWNCPAFYAKLCDSSQFEHYKPSSHQLKEIIDLHSPPRVAIHHSLIESGRIHPLPECRLNEYACLINASLYNKEVRPDGNVLPFGGSWHGTDTGAAWFYEMYNLGYKFINTPFEPYVIHAPFSSNGSGHVGNSDFDLYIQSESKAHKYLLENNLIRKSIPFKIRIERKFASINPFFTQITSRLKSLANP